MTDTYYLCAAGDRLRDQINRRWPNRDKASDGWIGDASHAAVPSDHNPDWKAGGVVRAIDVDANLSTINPEAAQTLANQLIRCARDGDDGRRLSYVIYNRRIASGTYAETYWTWRPYPGTDPHTSHIHVSFKPRGDDRGAPFPLPVFGARERRRLRARIAELRTRIAKARIRLESLTP